MREYPPEEVKNWSITKTFFVLQYVRLYNCCLRIKLLFFKAYNALLRGLLEIIVGIETIFFPPK